MLFCCLPSVIIGLTHTHIHTHTHKAKQLKSGIIQVELCDNFVVNFIFLLEKSINFHTEIRFMLNG